MITDAGLLNLPSGNRQNLVITYFVLVSLHSYCALPLWVIY
nr:MAG TPA: hypothetical protein [Caudoviricetes sp.]DAY99343.1 MAG TPA: hypothetical protein [Caudoviricetes sp.]